MNRYLQFKFIKYIKNGGVLALASFLIIGFVLLMFKEVEVKSKATSGLSAVNILNLINQERQKVKINPLYPDQRLTQAAVLKARDMSQKNYFSHNSPSGKTGISFVDDQNYKYKKAGENLAINFFEDESVTIAWMNSAGHRRNILDSNFTSTGLAISTGKNNGITIFYVVQFFAKPATDQPVSSSLPVEKPAPQLKQNEISKQSQTPIQLDKPKESIFNYLEGSWK